MSKFKEKFGIYAIFNLNEIPKNKSEVTGISDLLNKTQINKQDILTSRGEFAGYFTENGRLVLFRDRIGARNIYYSFQDNKIILSTDLEWIAENSSPKPNWDYIKTDYLQFQIPFDDRTFFQNIKKVIPGEMVSIEGKHITKEKYWDLQFGNNAFDKSHLLELIKDAVNFRLAIIKDAPFTSYLSGGLDSSAITIMAKPKICFSGFYEEEGYSEIDYIESVVTKMNNQIEYKSIKITQDKFYKYMDKLPHILPDPSCGLGVIPQVIVAQEAAKEGYEYAFTGEGGDEIFLGYNWNTIIFTLANAAKNLMRDRYMVRYEGMIEKVLSDGFATFTGGLLCRGDDLLYATKQILDIWNKSDSVENNISKINIKLGLPAILSVDERVGYFSGIMPISPLMDHKIVEYVCSIRPEERAIIPKYVFREAMEGILPEKIRMRYDKMGFPVPVAKWNWPSLNKSLKSLEQRNIFKLDNQKNQYMDRKSWALFSIESWLKHYSEL